MTDVDDPTPPDEPKDQPEPEPDDPIPCRSMCCGCTDLAHLMACESATDDCLNIPEGPTRSVCLDNINATYLNLCNQQ